MDILVKLEEKMKRHNWYYHYSDDHRYWSAGQASMDEIVKLEAEALKSGFDEAVDKLRVKYCPWAKENA